MANTNTDLTEEDAADLQFPKGEFADSDSIITDLYNELSETSPSPALVDFCSQSFNQFTSGPFSSTLASSDSSVCTNGGINSVGGLQGGLHADMDVDMDKDVYLDVDVDVSAGVEQLCCGGCATVLAAPFVFCDVCKLGLCTVCFSVGAEFLAHRNDHAYRIFRDDFLFFEHSDWTAREEVALLDSVLKFGNWGLVARQFPGRSEKEVKEHYEYFYVQGYGSDLLPKMAETAASVFMEPLVPYRLKIANTEDPPRYLPHHIGYHALAGYNAARSDFEVEYDRSAEALLSNLQDIDVHHPHRKKLEELHCAIVRIYNRRLMERRKRKEIIRNHGLIAYRKTSAWLHRYDVTITKPVYVKLLRFMQFCTGTKFEFIMEGLHRAGELKYRIFSVMGNTRLSYLLRYLKSRTMVKFRRRYPVYILLVSTVVYHLVLPACKPLLQSDYHPLKLDNDLYISELKRDSLNK